MDSGIANGEINVENQSCLNYEINGTRFILRTCAYTQDIMKIDSPEILESASANRSEESVTLLCLDGQAYIFQNGELKELDSNRLIDSENCQEDVDETRHILSDNDQDTTNGINQQVENDYEIMIEQQEKGFTLTNQPVNPDDFVEVVSAFKCKMCPFTTQNRTQLLYHFENIHANPIIDPKVQSDETRSIDDIKLVYMCVECSNCFTTIEDCKQHMIKDHRLVDKSSKNNNVNESKDPNSTTESTGGKSNSKHSNKTNTWNSEDKKINETKEKIVKCLHRGCCYKFTTEQRMQQHAACHVEFQDSMDFKCNICKDAKFTKWRPCSMHMWKKHQIDVDLLTCKICQVYKSATMVKLLTHMRVHSETRDYECPDCGKCFKQSGQLRNHRVMHLDRKTLEIPRWYTSKTCELCGKIYADSKCLKNHIQAVHSKLRPYVCNVCGHSSARKAMLQMHLRQHTGDKPFSCHLCEYKTGDHNSLRRHIMRHTGVRPYKCPHCPYSAIQSNSYKNHLKSKHPSLAGLFTCNLCPFKTVKKESYVQHIGDHEKGLIKTNASKEASDDGSVEVFPGNIAAAQLIYNCLGAFSKIGRTLEENLMSSSTSADGTSQTITIQIPSKHLEDSLPSIKNESGIDQEDEETMHCFLKIPREEEENIDTGGITIPAEPEGTPTSVAVNVTL